MERGTKPAPVTRSTTAVSSSRLAMPFGVRASAGNRRPRSPWPACTQQRVRNRVEDDVAVGVAEQSRCVRERDAAKGQRPVGSEWVGVIAEADTQAREVAAECVLDAGEVGRERHFDVARVA